MEDKELIYKYLQSLEDSIYRIRHMNFTFDMVLGDEDIQDLLDRRMQKAIEACIDIAIHTASELRLPRQEKVADVFNVLAENHILNKEVTERLKGAVGFRNILVHEYDDVDYQLAYSDLESKLKDLEDFAYQIRAFISKKQKPSS